MPSATFFTQATDLKFSLMLARLEHGHRRIVVVAQGAADDVQPRQGLRHREPRPLLATRKVDALTEDALQTVDDIKREAYLQRATEIAINDTGLIPLHFQVNLWAARDGIVYQPRVDEQTLAHKMRPKGGGG